MIDAAFAQKRKTIRNSMGANGFDKAAILESAFDGGYPEALGLRPRAKRQWFKAYLDALLLHDIRKLMDVRAYVVLRKMMEAMLARSSKFFTENELTSALQIKHETFVRFLAILKTLYLIDEIPPWQDSDYADIGKRSKFIAADTGMMASVLNWNIDEVSLDSDRSGKIVETWVYNQIAPQLDINPDYSISQYRDSRKREIDFVVESGNGCILGIEVKSGSTVGKGDFTHLSWFRDNIVKQRRFIGIVLYTGEHTLPFGKSLYAVPMGTLCT